jgi:hypothetical protein
LLATTGIGPPGSKPDSRHASAEATRSAGSLTRPCRRVPRLGCGSITPRPRCNSVTVPHPQTEAR